MILYDIILIELLYILRYFMIMIIIMTSFKNPKGEAKNIPTVRAIK